jgi:amino acid adenylation domain-containing protein
MSQELLPAGESAGYRLSPLQARAWLTQDAAPPRGQCLLHLDGPLDPLPLRVALRGAVERHEILRTTFRRRVGLQVPVQVIGTEAEFGWETADLAALAPAEQEARLDTLLREDARWGDVEAGPAVRATLVALAADRHLLLLSAPKLCADARSFILLAEELCVRYAGGEPLTDQPLQYADYAEWHHQLLEASDEAEARAAREYRDRQAAVCPPRAIPFRRRAALAAAGPPVSVPRTIPGDTMRLAAALAKRSGATAEAVLLACWQGLVARLTGEKEAAVGCVFDGRTHPDLQGALGLFARRLPVACPSVSTPFEEAVEQVRRAADEAARRQDYLGAETAEPAGVDFEWLAPFAPRVVRGVRFALRHLACDPGPFGLKLSCLPLEDGCLATFSGDPALVREDDVRRIAGYFERLLTGALRDPAAPLTAVEILDDEERRRLLVALNATAADFPRQKTIQQLFEEQVERTPERPALAFRGERLSYRELNARANRLAHHLRRRGAGRNAVVGLCLERSAEAIVGLLGILKAGAAYMPLHPESPLARLAHQIAEARAAIVLTQESLAPRLPDFGGEVVCLDRDRDRLEGESAANPQRLNDPNDLVYVIFTSGSTGLPKGVATRHRNLVNYAAFIGARLGLGVPGLEGLHFATVSTLSADLGNTCIFPALLSGSCLHVVEHETSVDGRLFADYLAGNPIDVLKITPSHLGALLGTGPAEGLLPRKYLVLGGEAASWDLVRRVTEAGRCAVLNHYGPTETTVGSLTFGLGQKGEAHEDSATVPIGRPIANTDIYVVDPDGKLVPFGVPGELWVGGAGVASGYLNQPGLTAERFVPDPFSPDPAARVYRTGDRVRYLGDGAVEFLGRLDRQVKVRGFRVELAEIEAVLRGHPSVRQAAVTAATDNGATTRLAGYYVAAEGCRLAPDEVRRFLKEHLPEHMTPATLTALECLPLTANGKIDERALPDPDKAAAAGTSRFVPPRDPSEERLVEIWKEVLGVERVGIHEDFFDLGGHSLLATQVISRVQSALQVQLPLRVIFEAPTVAGLAEALSRSQEEQQKYEIDKILTELDGLSDAEVERLLALEQ